MNLQHAAPHSELMHGWEAQTSGWSHRSSLLVSHYGAQKATAPGTDLHLCQVVSTSINVSVHTATKCVHIIGGLMLINANRSITALAV